MFILTKLNLSESILTQLIVFVVIIIFGLILNHFKKEDNTSGTDEFYPPQHDIYD